MSVLKPTAARPWVRFYDDCSPASLHYPDVRLDALLTETAARHPDQPAMVFGARLAGRTLDRTVTYAQLEEDVRRWEWDVQEKAQLGWDVQPPQLRGSEH